MADSLDGTFRLIFNAVFENALSASLGTTSVTLNKVITLSTSDGTTTDKADKTWGSTSRSLSGATSENIDVYDFGAIDIGAGAGKDPLGNSITLAEIVVVLIENNASSDGNLTIGGEGSVAAWNSPFGGSDTNTFGPLKPGGWIMFGMGKDPAFAVADSSNHLLKMASTATLTYDIYIAGRSA